MLGVYKYSDGSYYYGDFQDGDWHGQGTTAYMLKMIFTIFWTILNRKIVPAFYLFIFPGEYRWTNGQVSEWVSEWVGD